MGDAHRAFSTSIPDHKVDIKLRLIFTRDGMPNAARYGTDRWRFQDSNPFHMLSNDSVDAINKAVPNRTYTCDNFRPNIVVKTLNGLPWDEVGTFWKTLRITSESKHY